MHELFKTLNILESILSSDNPLLEATIQRSKLLKEIEQLEKEMYENYLKSQQLSDTL